MNEIYFEVPVSTRETKVCISHGDDLWIFRIIFFESEYADVRTVTVIGECKEDLSQEIQTLSSRTDDSHGNNFAFKFEATDGVEVAIEIYEDVSSFRSINVTY